MSALTEREKQLVDVALKAGRRAFYNVRPRYCAALASDNRRPQSKDFGRRYRS
jgi:hypothetical protein